MLMVFIQVIQKWVYIVSAEPAAVRSSFATKSEVVDQQKEDVTQVSPSLQGSRTTGGTTIWTGTQETSPETEPPQEKRAKRELGEVEQEEGEIVDSSEEDEEEEEEGNAEENSPCDNSCGNAKSPANDMQVIKDVLGDGVDTVTAAGTGV